MMEFSINTSYSVTMSFRTDGTMERHTMASLDVTMWGKDRYLPEHVIKGIISEYNAVVESCHNVDYGIEGYETTMYEIRDIPEDEIDKIIEVLVESIGVKGATLKETVLLSGMNGKLEEWNWT